MNQVTEGLFFTRPLDQEGDSEKVCNTIQEIIDLLSYPSLRFKDGGIIFFPIHSNPKDRYAIGGWTIRGENVCVYGVPESNIIDRR